MIVWHYTSLDVLQLILDSGTLLATEVNFQNDVNEAAAADQLFYEVLDELADDPVAGPLATFSRHISAEMLDAVYGPMHGSRRMAESRFILCASSDPDNLYAWRTYGSASSIGCAIGIDTDAALGVVVDGEHSGPSTWRTHRWTEINYDIEVHRRWLIERLGDLTRSLAKPADRDELEGLYFRQVGPMLSRLRTMVKDQSFADEAEHRVSIDGAQNPAAVTFTPSGMGPRPHLRLGTAANRWGEHLIGPRRENLPIRAVRLAPGAPETAELSVEWLLHTRGYNTDGVLIDEFGDWHQDDSIKVKILGSRHPYRKV